MKYFPYHHTTLHAESVPIVDIVAEYGTPCYIYSRAALEQQWHEFNNAIIDHPHLICFAVKANGNIGILNLLARLGSGFDIVSGGELARVLAAGADPQKIVFSGVGKTVPEIQFALKTGIHCFNVESEAELLRINDLAGALNKKAPIALRINPDIDVNTHPYIATGLQENKFGIPYEQALALYQKAQALEHLQIIGIDCHIGSQLTELKPFLAALDRLRYLIDELKNHGIELEHIDVGGGLGIVYDQREKPLPPTLSAYGTAIVEQLKNYPDLTLIIEPGRAIAGPAGILVTRVEYLKSTDCKQFAITDAGMNDLLRPALYHAWQNIIPVRLQQDLPTQIYDVVGPVCESADFLGHERALAIQTGDLLAICTAGAYGFSMSSQYNARPRPPEILVDGNHVHCLRPRETVESLFEHEHKIF